MIDIGTSINNNASPMVGIGMGTGLMSNPLFLQYMSALGAGIAGGNPAVNAMNQVTQQGIAAQNMAKLIPKMSAMLSGQTLPPAGAKIITDANGTTVSMPNSALGNELAGGSPQAIGANAAPGVNTPQPPAQGVGGITATQPSNQKTSGILSALNPSVSSAISGADLAGLNPSEISGALSGAINIEALKQQQIENLIRLSKGGGAINPEDQQFPVAVPGVGNVTLREWSSLPSDDKNYALYVQLSKKEHPEETILSKKDWLRTVNPTDRESYYQMFIDNPEYFKMEKELRKAGATTIGEKLAVTEGSKKIEQEAYVKSPTLFQDVESDLQKDAQGWYTISSEVTDNPKYANTPRKDLVEIDHKLKILKETDNRIKQVYGNRVVVKPDGWYVGGKLIQRNPYYGK